MTKTDTRFTPVDSETGRRLIMHLDAEDAARVAKRKEEPALVIDQATGFLYLIEARDCGSDCYCDAWATEIYPDELEDDAAAKPAALGG